jgi:hypothetical protein
MHEMAILVAAKRKEKLDPSFPLGPLAIFP